MKRNLVVPLLILRIFLNTSTSTWSHRSKIAGRILAKYFFRSLGGLNRLLQPKINFYIKPGYHHASKSSSFDDSSNTDEWQKEVYIFAASLAKERNYSSVIDLGCGSGFKLLHYLGFCQTTGVETGRTYEWLKQNHPDHQWLLYEKINPSGLKTDLIICSDVIEHIKNPDELIGFIRSMQSQCIIFSTPERDAIAGQNDYGPPENTSHYREWNADEFRNYISQWFHIEEQRIFNARSVTQVIVAKK